MKEKLLNVGWKYLDHISELDIYGRGILRILHDRKSDTIVGFYCVKVIYMKQPTKDQIEMFLKPEEK